MNYEGRYNTKIKIYPDKCFKATYCNKCIFSNENIQVSHQCNNIEIGNLENEDNGIYQDWEFSLKDWCIYPYGWDTALSLETEKEEFEQLENITAEELISMGIYTFEDFLKRNQNNNKKEKKSKNSAINLERSLKRAKERIFDMAYINEFKYFVTVTFDTQKVDSSNAKDVMKKLRVWLMHQKQRYNMEYILVPEYHKKGGIHCHLLITDYPTRLLEHAQRHTKGGELAYNKDGSPCLMYTNKGQPIYNMLGWKYGFSTCIPIYKAVNESNIKLAHYITKYMTKDVHKIFGKFYWSSKGLKREVDVQLFNSDYDKLPLKEYEIPNTNIRLKYDSQFDYVIGGKTKTHEKGS